MAYDLIEPVGAARADVLTAVLGALIGNQWRDKESAPLTPETVLKALPWWNDGETAAQPPEQHWSVRVVEEMWAAMVDSA